MYNMFPFTVDFQMLFSDATRGRQEKFCGDAVERLLCSNLRGFSIDPIGRNWILVVSASILLTQHSLVNIFQ